MAKPSINYTDRDFDSIRQSLVDHAKRYYADTYRDFNEAGFGSLMIDTVSYVGDILSFYLDYQANESFLSTAIEYNNTVKLAQQLGYKQKGAASSHGYVTLYLQVPAASLGLNTDSRYLPILKKGAQFRSKSGVAYLLVENVDFANPKNEVVVGQVDSVTGTPTTYAVRAYGRVVSGELKSETITLGGYTPYLRVQLKDTKVSEILRAFDDEGHDYYEVDYLSQDVIYREVANKDTESKTNDKGLVVPPVSVLKPVTVPRRFMVEHVGKSTFLQFGYGNETELDAGPGLISDPANVVMNVYGKEHITDTSFDPNNLVQSDKFGISPSNTTFTIVYRSNNKKLTNSGVGAISSVSNADFSFPDITVLDAGLLNSVQSSLEVTNESPVTGGQAGLMTADEIRLKAYDTYASQNRAVTKQDYLSVIYRMPGAFGQIKRANILQDSDSFKRNLNVYCLSENVSGHLAPPNTIIKKNLKTWINKYKMINDTVDILNAKVINIGIDFTAIAKRGTNKYDLLLTIYDTLRETFTSQKMQIGERFYITDIYTTINRIEGVVDTTEVFVNQKLTAKHSQVSFKMSEALSADGRFIEVPENVALEIRYPTEDIKGTIL
jgi:hypothetical protein